MVKKYFLNYFTIILLIVTYTGYCQTPPPVTIEPPTVNFSFLCQSESFENSTITFNIKPITNLTSTDKDNFSLEISKDNFISSNITIPITSASVTGNDVTLTFKLPEDTYGNYKFRVKTKSPVASATTSKIYPLYYLIHNDLFTINKNVDNVTVCGGGSYTISIDETPYNGINSPLTYPRLTYNWYTVNGVVETLIPGQKGKSLSVNQSGVYRVKTDYGVCTGSTNSQNLKDVTVKISSEKGSATISNNATDDLCDGNPRTLTATTSGNPPISFKWSKDGVIIPGSGNTITVQDPGKYVVTVDNGICQFDSNTITLTPGVDGIEAKITPDPVTSPITISPGEEVPIKLTIIKAINPVVTWTFNEQPLDVTGDTFIAKDKGRYTIKVTQTGGCNSAFERTIIIRNAGSATLIPNLVTANNDGANDTWDIPTEYSSQDITVQILNSLGKVVFESKNYQGTWPESNFTIPTSDPVFYYVIYQNDKSIKQGSITVLK